MFVSFVDFGASKFCLCFFLYNNFGTPVVINLALGAHCHAYVSVIGVWPLQTPQRETVLHIALRLGHVVAVQLVLEAPNFDVVKCDSLQTHKVLRGRRQFVVDVPGCAPSL